MKFNLAKVSKWAILSLGTLVFVCISQSQSFAQEGKIYKITEKPPKPNGGMCAFFQYTEDNLKRPDEALKNGVKGNVFVQFVIEKDGKLSNIHVIKGLGSGVDEAVVKLLENAPPWNPGLQQGQAVRVKKTMSIAVR